MEGIVTLADAKALNEAGIEIETNFAWYQDTDDPDTYEPSIYLKVAHDAYFEEKGMFIVSAPSVAELLDWLPNDIDNILHLVKGLVSKEYHAYYVDSRAKIVGETRIADTPEAALTKLALWVASQNKDNHEKSL